jgi:hypothetical protein
VRVGAPAQGTQGENRRKGEDGEGDANRKDRAGEGKDAIGHGLLLTRFPAGTKPEHNSSAWPLPPAIGLD